MQGDLETRDEHMRNLTGWTKWNGTAAGIAFVAAGINAYVSLRNGSPDYSIAAGYNATVGVLQACSVYTQFFLRQNLANMTPDPSFDPATQPELREYSSISEKAGTYIGFALVGISGGAGVDALLDL